MSRIRGSGEIGLVASIASCGKGSVVVIDVALCAGDGGMRAGQWECRVVVIKGRPGPGRGVVACGAGGGEARRGVGGIGGSVPIRFVAGVAIGRNRSVVVVNVALRTRNGYMRAGQREGPS